MLIVHSHPSTSQAQNAGRCCPLATNLEYARNAPRRITQTTALTIGKWKNTGRIDGRARTASATSEGPSGGSRAAAAVADGCREVVALSLPEPGGCSLSACISATTIPVAELVVDTWPPISSGSA